MQELEERVEDKVLQSSGEGSSVTGERGKSVLTVVPSLEFWLEAIGTFKPYTPYTDKA